MAPPGHVTCRSHVQSSNLQSYPPPPPTKNSMLSQTLDVDHQVVKLQDMVNGYMIVRRPFADAFVLRCFAFQPSDAQLAAGHTDKPNLMLFPPTESGKALAGCLPWSKVKRTQQLGMQISRAEPACLT